MKYLEISGILLLICVSIGCQREPRFNNQPPDAVISASPSSGQVPLTVQFNASSSSDPEGSALTYLWEISDGSTSNLVSFSKTFENSGSFTVNLTVTDAGGLEDYATKTITADTPPPDLFPISENAQWVYAVKATDTENGAVSDYDEGFIYIIAQERDPEFTNIDVMDLRVTGKKYYSGSSLIPGEYIHMLHVPGQKIDIYHSPGGSAYARMIDLEVGSWSNYAMFFSQASSQSASRSLIDVTIGLGTFSTYRVKHQRDNWGEKYVNERYDISESEYFAPDIGLVYRETSRYVNFLDCFYCPVYGGSVTMELVGYHIPQEDGSVLQDGYGYNTDNPYGGDIGLLTIWADEDIGTTSVYFDGEYVGMITNYWPGGLSCDQSGALNVTYPDGVYLLTAESSKGYQWEGNVTVVEGICDDVKLLLTKKSIGQGGIPRLDK